MGIWYATREDVKSALDSQETARNNAQIDRALEAATAAIWGLTHRRFYPETGTRYFDWPTTFLGNPYRLWLDADEVISVSAIESGGVDLESADYFLEPANSGPPHTHIDIDLSGPGSFNSGRTHQRSIAVTGVFGYSAEEAAAGQLAEALDNSEVSVDVTDSAAIGVGTIIRVDDERMVVQGKLMLTTGQTLQGTLTQSNADVTVPVTTGSEFGVGEVLLLNAEKMLIVDIAGNNLIVKRAWDGSVLAAHTNSTIYAPRTLLVERGALGTTAAAHSTATAINRHVVPGLIRLLAIAEALSSIQQEGAAYGRVVGSGESAREASGKGLGDLRAQAYASFGRKARIRAI